MANLRLPLLILCVKSLHVEQAVAHGPHMVAQTNLAFMVAICPDSGPACELLICANAAQATFAEPRPCGLHAHPSEKRKLLIPGWFLVHLTQELIPFSLTWFTFREEANKIDEYPPLAGLDAGGQHSTAAANAPGRLQ